MAILSPLTLAREKRIRKRRDFLRVQKFGFRYFGRFVVAVAQRCRDGETGRVGFTVPKKVGAAHVRNKIKRRLRHIARENQSLFFEQAIVIVARDNAALATFSELKRDLLETCRKLKNRAHEARSRNFARRIG